MHPDSRHDTDRHAQYTIRCRHKSDSDLRQTLMLEEEAFQGQQQQTLYPHTPSAPPPVTISLSDTYPMPTTHWSHPPHFRASTGTTPLSVSLNTDHMHSTMAQAKSEFLVLSIQLSVCSSVCLPSAPSVCMYVCLSVCMSVCMFVCMYVCLLSVCMSVCMFVCMYVCLLSVCLSVCMYVSVPDYILMLLVEPFYRPNRIPFIAAVLLYFSFTASLLLNTIRTLLSVVAKGELVSCVYVCGCRLSAMHMHTLFSVMLLSLHTAAKPSQTAEACLHQFSKVSARWLLPIGHKAALGCACLTPTSLPVSTCSHDQSVGRYPEAPPFPIPPHQLSLSKGASSSLPDLTNADFSSGLPTPLDQDDSSMEGEDHLPVNIPDFAHYLPTRQVPQGQPKPPQSSPYAGYLVGRTKPLEATPPQGVGRQHLSVASPLSPLATTRKSGSTRPTRSITVSSFTELAEEGGPPTMPVCSVDDSMLMDMAHQARSGSAHKHAFSQSCDQAALRDRCLPEAVARGRGTNTLPGNVQHHFFPEQIGIASIAPSGSGTTESFSLSQGVSATPAPLSANYNCHVPDKPSPSYSSPVPGGMSYPSVGQVHPLPLRAAHGNPLQQSSYTTDNIPSSSTPAVPLVKRLPPSYYEHQMKHSQPTAVIQERLTSISLHQDLTRSWSEENLFAKNPPAAQKEKGSPVHNPFMGTMATASSVPCVRVDVPTDVLAMMGQGGTPGSPDSPESTSTETPPSTLRYNPPPTLNLTGFYEWPLDLSRRESLGGQYRSLTDLTTAMGMDTGTAFPNQKVAAGTASSSLFHPTSLPCLQNELDDIDHIDGLIDQLGYPLMESLLKQEGINFDFGDVIADESYQEMDSSGQ